jgi:hypothetical protein
MTDSAINTSSSLGRHKRNTGTFIGVGDCSTDRIGQLRYWAPRWNMPETPASLEDPCHTGRSLFALKRIAEALLLDLLTLSAAKSAAARISPHYSAVFDSGAGTSAQRAARVVKMIETILQRRFPSRFRAST